MGEDMRVGSEFRGPGKWLTGVDMRSDIPGAGYIGCKNDLYRADYPKGSHFTRAKMSTTHENEAITTGADSNS